MLPTMATLKDIADICGVSTATVSYVLSGRGTEKRITEQTQQEIRKAAESLDYEYKGRNKAVLKYRVTVYFPLSGLKMLLPTFLDASTASWMRKTPILTSCCVPTRKTSCISSVSCGPRRKAPPPS